MSMDEGKTTTEIVLRSALGLDVCSHLNSVVTVEFIVSKNSNFDIFNILTREINLCQYHKEFIWMSPDDPAPVWMRFESFWWARRTYTQGLAASSPLCPAMRSELHFSPGSSLDLAITVESQAALGLWLRAGGWARDVASHLGRGIQGYRRSRQTQGWAWVSCKTTHSPVVCSGWFTLFDCSIFPKY